MAIIPYLPAILSALVQLAKLLYEMAKEKSEDKIKDCAVEIEDARRTGDVSKLTKIIEEMRKGKPCK
jgi:ribosomal protein L18E